MEKPYLKFEQIGMSFRRGQMATEVLRDIGFLTIEGRVRPVADRPLGMRQVHRCSSRTSWALPRSA